MYYGQNYLWYVTIRLFAIIVKFKILLGISLKREMFRGFSVNEVYFDKKNNI